MKNRLTRGISLFLLMALSVFAAAAPPIQSVPGELIVKFRSGAKDSEIKQGLQRGRLKVKKHLLHKEKKQQQQVEEVISLVETDLEVSDAVAVLRNDPSVEYVEPNYIYTHQATANDPYAVRSYLWGMHGAESSPASTYGSQATAAWGAGYVGSGSVIVGVIDDGIETTHPDLAPNIWRNPYDPVDGVDNDGNGYVDDVHGWDFYNGRNNLYDSAAGDAHGTHVAGTIGAKGGNGAGVAGMNWNVTMIGGKFMSGGSGSTFGAVAAINYFIDLKKRHGLNIVALNASWGGQGYSRTLHDAVIRAAKEGILFIAAAGNDGLNTDATAYYPANLNTTQGTSSQTAASYNGVITVAAIDVKGALAAFSNYSPNKVHLGAPGVSILSSYKGSYAYMNGTSMATPHVAGAVALYASTHPGANAAQIRQALLGAVTATPSLSGKTTTGGRLTLSSVIVPIPAAPTGLVATSGDKVVSLKWDAAPNASGYVVERGSNNVGPFAAVQSGITGTTWADNQVVNGVTYFYRLAAVNAGKQGAYSSVVSASPKAAIQPPGAPSGLFLTVQPSTVAGRLQVTNTWKAGAGAQSYTLRRATSQNGPWTVVASGITGTKFVHITDADLKTYFYYVTAENQGGQSGPSNLQGVYTVGPIPAHAKLTPTSPTTATLTWTDRSSDEDGFALEFWNGSNWLAVGTAPANATAVNFTGLVSGVTYNFRLKAYNAGAASGYSARAWATQP